MYQLNKATRSSSNPIMLIVSVAAADIIFVILCQLYVFLAGIRLVAV